MAPNVISPFVTKGSGENDIEIASNFSEKHAARNRGQSKDLDLDLPSQRVAFSGDQTDADERASSMSRAQ